MKQPIVRNSDIVVVSLRCLNYLEAAAAGTGGFHAGVPVLLLADPALHHLARRWRSAVTGGGSDVAAVVDGQRRLRVRLLPGPDGRLQHGLREQPVHQQREVFTHVPYKHARTASAAASRWGCV